MNKPSHIIRDGKRRRCLICNEAMTVTTDDNETIKDLVWRFERLHRHDPALRRAD